MDKYTVYAQMRDEDNLIGFWIEHYIKLGFDHLYIVDDCSQNSIKNIIADKYNHNFDKITVIEIDFTSEEFISGDMKKSQFYDADIYKYCYASKQNYILSIFHKLYHDKMEWIFICDADEFLYLKNHNTIEEYMSEYITKYPNMSGIVFQWLTYGTSYHSYFPQGHLFENFLYSDFKLHDSMKSITRVNDAEDFGVHNCRIKRDKFYYMPTKNDIIMWKGWQKRNSMPNYTQVNAFCAHYVTLDCHTFYLRRFKRSRDNYDKKLYTGIANWISYSIDLINKSMLKYINTNKIVEIENMQYKHKLIDIEKYNLKYNASCHNIYDTLKHFYDNKTEIIYTDIRENLPEDFNIPEYKKLISHVNMTDIEAIKHYISAAKHGRVIYKLNLPEDFNVLEYKRLNSDIKTMTNIEAMQHYIFAGKRENRIYKLNLPNDFDVLKYKELNPDLNNMTDIEAMKHYMYAGNRENRIYKLILPIDFNVSKYKELNFDLNNMTDIEAMKHYICAGQRERRIYK